MFSECYISVKLKTHQWLTKHKLTVHQGSTRSEMYLRGYGRDSAHGTIGHLIEPSWGNPLNYFPFQPLFYDWCNMTNNSMCYHVCEMVHIKEPLLLTENSSPCGDGSRFPLSLSEWSFTICSMPYNHK